MRTPENIVRHELIGLQCFVEKARNKHQVGIKGKIVDETMKTIMIDGKRVEKKGSEFIVSLGGKKVHIDGDAITGRPEDRIKKKIRKW